MCIISRLDYQKGFDLLLQALDGIMETGAGLVILGSGNPWITEELRKSADRYQGRMALRTGFDGHLAHRILAGSDLFLMPSLYEPCGLTQMYALKYGTVPVVRGTGGLEDTVFTFDLESGKGNGFKFYPYSSDAFLNAVRQGVDVYGQRRTWRKVMKNGMEMDFSWDRSAREYAAIYLRVL